MEHILSTDGNSGDHSVSQNPDRTIVMPADTTIPQNPDRTIVMPADNNSPQDTERTIVMPAGNTSSLNPDKTIDLSTIIGNAPQTGKDSSAQSGKKSGIRDFISRSTGLKIDVSEAINPTKKKAANPVVIDTEDVSSKFEDVDQRYTRQQYITRGKRMSLYKCKDEILGRSVAMSIPDEACLLDDAARVTTIREAEVCAQLDHPSILPVYGIYTDYSGSINVANKILDGMILQLYLEKISAHYRTDGMNSNEERESLRRRLQILLEICNGIEYAHSRNIMHGNLSSRRIFIGEYHEIYIAGWSMARHIVNTPPDPVRLENQEGTAFTAPEYFASNPTVDTRSDVYSLGMLMYELVTLRMPFDDLTQDEIREKLGKGELPPIEHRFRYRFDSDLRAMIQKAIAINPKDRYQSVEQLSSDVRHYLALEPISFKKQNISARYTRFILKHQYTFFSLFPMILIAIALLVAATFWLSGRHTAQNRLNEQITFKAFASCMRLTNSLTSNIEQIQLQLRSTARDVEQLLSGSTDPLQPDLTDWLWDSDEYSGIKADFRSFEKMPAGMKFNEDLVKKLHSVFFSLESSFFVLNGKHYSYGGTPLFKIELVFNDGTTLCYPFTEDFNSYEVTPPAWRKTALQNKTGDLLLLDPEEVSYIDNLKGFLALPFTYPIRDAEQKQIGAIVFVVSNFALATRLSEADNCRGGMVAQYFATLPDGNIVYEMKDGLAQTSRTVDDIAIEPGLLEHLNSGSGFGKEIRHESGGNFIYCWTRFNCADRNLIYLEKIRLDSFKVLMKQEEKARHE